MKKLYMIEFTDNDVHVRWAARAGGDKRVIEIPANWWSVGYDQKFHFEHLVENEELRGLLSRDDKVRFEAAYKVYAETCDGSLTEGTDYEQANLQQEPSQPTAGE